MKRFLGGACGKIGRFFCSWGFLKFVLWTITLIIFFYVEEDWRGARAWAATKAEWEAKGESFDYTKFIPPPIPDDQNLAAIPIFKLELKKSLNGSSYLDPVALWKALGNRSDDNDFPPHNNWPSGELPDLEEIRQTISADYFKAFKSAPESNDPLVQLDALYPFTADLRAAAGRPYCQFQYDGTEQTPMGRSLELINSQIFISKILTVHALLELENHQTDLALEDLKINFKLTSGVRRDSDAISAYVAVPMTWIGSGAVYDGLAGHLWNDGQLVEIDHLLEPADFLADYQNSLRCYVATQPFNIDYYKQASWREKYEYVNDPLGPKPFWCHYAFLWPRGWWDLNKSRAEAFSLASLSFVDPKSHRVYPDLANELQRQIRLATDLSRWGMVAPWNSCFFFMIGDNSPEFAQAQVRLDETRIACALERYHLSHGVYPGSLDALVPACIDELPHDIMNGEPYHYRFRADGTFLLYSVGWNQTDDGGRVLHQKKKSNVIDYKEGDWVWPTPGMVNN
jgi:hypothetical protein